MYDKRVTDKESISSILPSVKPGQAVKFTKLKDGKSKPQILSGIVHDISSNTITIQTENYRTGININDLITKRIIPMF